MLKRKLSVSLIVGVNMAFVFCTFILSDSNEHGLITSLINFFTIFLVVSIIMVTFISIIALISSTLIEVKFSRMKHGHFYSFILHVLTGILIGIALEVTVFQDTSYSSTTGISYSIFYSLYPAISFYLIDYFLKRNSLNIQN